MRSFDDDDSPIRGLGALRDVVPPPSLVPGVMRRISEPAPMSFWDWLRKPRRMVLRFSPVGALSVCAIGGLMIFAVAGSWSAGRGRGSLVVEVPALTTRTATTLATENPAVVVRFTLMAQGARKVAVAGDFNNWDPSQTPLLNQDGSGAFAATLRLPPGQHEYMFVVDGEWVTDPAAAERRPDGFGRTNAVLRL